MSTPRKLATGLLRAVLRHAPPESHDWASAMLRELDYIEGDWEALFWALGSTFAIFRYSGRRSLARFVKYFRREETTVTNFWKTTGGILAGIVIAIVLAVTALGLIHASFHFFPGLAPWHHPNIAWTIAITLPETIFLITAFLLWRKRRNIAVGVLVTAVLVATHFAIHLAQHHPFGQ